MRRSSVLTLVALLAACSDEPSAPINQEANGQKPSVAAPEAEPPAGTNESAPAAKAEDAAAPAQNAPAPAPAVAEAEWTGRFAATPDLCRYGAWQIARDKVITGGETSCTIGNVAESGGSVVLTLACMAEGNRTNERWTLTPGPNEALAVKRETGEETIEVGLRRCD